MCGEGCLKTIKKVTLAVPASGGKKETRLVKARLIEEVGRKPLIAPPGCGSAIDLGQFLKKTGAKILD